MLKYLRRGNAGDHKIGTKIIYSVNMNISTCLLMYVLDGGGKPRWHRCNGQEQPGLAHILANATAESGAKAQRRAQFKDQMHRKAQG